MWSVCQRHGWHLVLPVERFSAQRCMQLAYHVALKLFCFSYRWGLCFSLSLQTAISQLTLAVYRSPEFIPFCSPHQLRVPSGVNHKRYNRTQQPLSTPLGTEKYGKISVLSHNVCYQLVYRWGLRHEWQSSRVGRGLGGGDAKWPSIEGPHRGFLVIHMEDDGDYMEVNN